MAVIEQAPRLFATIDELRGACGEVLGRGPWMEITQARVDAFAEVTEDRQWIHVDEERSALGPFGGTISHGYLTLALIPRLGADIFRVGGVEMAINYGINKVRFPCPVITGARIRAEAMLVSVTDTRSGVEAVIRYTVEIDRAEKPACVAETVRLLIPERL